MTLKASKIRQHNGCVRCGSDRLTAFTCSNRSGVEVHCMSCGEIETCYPGPTADDESFADGPSPLVVQVRADFRSQNRMKSWFKR